MQNIDALSYFFYIIQLVTVIWVVNKVNDSANQKKK